MVTHFIWFIRVHSTLQHEVLHAVMAVAIDGMLKRSLASLNGKYSTQSLLPPTKLELYMYIVYPLYTDRIDYRSSRPYTYMIHSITISTD